MLAAYAPFNPFRDVVPLTPISFSLNSRAAFKDRVPVVVMDSGDTDLEFSSCAATMMCVRRLYKSHRGHT